MGGSRWSPAVGGLALVATVAIALGRGEFASFVIGLGFVYLIAVLGLHVLLNDAGQFSLAHGAFVAVGAFTAAQVAEGIGDRGLPVALVAGAAAGAAAGAVVSLPVLRLAGFTVAITTWLFAIAADRYLFTQQWFVGTQAGVALAPQRLGPVRLHTGRAELVTVAVIAVAAIAVTGRLRRSRFGRSLLAVRSNEAMAAAVGIDVRAAKVAAYAVAGGYAGLAGGLYILMLGRAVPSSFPPFLSVTFLAIAIIGGRGRLAGPIAAAFLFASAPHLLGSVGRPLQYVSALSLVVVLVGFPGGLNEQSRRAVSLLTRRARMARMARA